MESRKNFACLNTSSFHFIYVPVQIPCFLAKQIPCLLSIKSAKIPTCSHDRAKRSASRDRRKLLTIFFQVFWKHDFTGIADTPCKGVPSLSILHSLDIQGTSRNLVVNATSCHRDALFRGEQLGFLLTGPVQSWLFRRNASNFPVHQVSPHVNARPRSTDRFRAAQKFETRCG